MADCGERGKPSGFLNFQPHRLGYLSSRDQMLKNKEIEAAPAPAESRGIWGAVQLILLTTGAQGAIQMLGFLSGLVVLRSLPIREYAYYTLANAALGTMTVLTDSGIAQSIMAQGGKVWQNPSALGGVISSGLRLRRQFAVAAISLWMPILYLMLRRQGATAATATLVAVSIIPLFVASLSGQLLQIVPRLHQRLVSLQRILIIAATARVALVASVANFFPLAWVVSLCAGVAQSWANNRVRALASKMADLDLPPDQGALAVAKRQVRRTAPGAIYYAFEGQISTWLISIFGKTQAIAQVGALGRLAMVFNIVGAVLALIWAPHFARMRTGPGVLRLFWGVQLALILLMGTVVLGVAWAPHAALAVLGHEYSSLTREVILVALAGSLAQLSGCAYVMSSSRAIVLAPWVSIPVALVLQISLLFWLPISTVSGVLWIGVLTNLAFWCMHVFNFTRVAMK